MANATGIVGEFFALKDGVDADILAMQCGDFYEFFGDDAELAARELDLKLSQKSSNGSSYPMAGVPVDDLTPYMRALVERGYRVAVADQHETEDGHAREVKRVVTPGTLIETTDESAAYLAAIVEVSESCVGLAFADITTGDFQVTRIDGDRARDRALALCHRFNPVEILPGPTLRDTPAFDRFVAEETEAEITTYDREAFAPGKATRTVTEQFGADMLSSVGLDHDPYAEVRAAGAIIDYVASSGVGILPAMTRITPFDDGRYVTLDVTTQRTLELTAPLIQSGTSLVETIDRTTTAAGARLLHEWIIRPLREIDVLEQRQASIGALVASPLTREAMRDHLSETNDLARLSNRATRGSADARTLVNIARTLDRMPDLRTAIDDDPRLAASPLGSLFADVDTEALDELASLLDSALRPDPPRTVNEGGLIQRGYDETLDDLIDRHENATTWIQDLAERERNAHGITHLQVDRNRTDGYYIQVGRSEVEKVPEEYHEIKALKNSKRYTTDELDEREREIVNLEAERFDLEYQLFQEIRETVADHAAALQDAGGAIAELDTYLSLALHAAEQGWTRPSIESEGHPIDIVDGRHPVVETSTSFVPNSTDLHDDRRVLLVTGPNMSGKSTYLRQTALITLLAQIGSFVPAEAASIGLVDGIFTRVGALDELSQGRSTFMVEMQELANILHSATEHSLVILDEVGRGTATYDGMSIAWAATEFLHNEIGAKTLFATHYHELTELAERLPAAANAHVAAEEDDGDVTFLRTVRDGRANRSYGIHVASLAGVPAPVRERAKRVLDDLREERKVEAKGADTTVQAVFDLDAGEITSAAEDEDSLPEEIANLLGEIADLSVDELPPIEVAQRVRAWQESLDED